MSRTAASRPLNRTLANAWRGKRRAERRPSFAGEKKYSPERRCLGRSGLWAGRQLSFRRHSSSA
jgi:hypothetical protein